MFHINGAPGSEKPFYVKKKTRELGLGELVTIRRLWSEPRPDTHSFHGMFSSLSSC
jgi:hypothetical protein